ncbi:MAG: amidohydrolase family protein [Steroidobacteraceae bacterium]|nr:amidohydrolase family protein [Steroidobacteraceae bacterium]
MRPLFVLAALLCLPPVGAAQPAVAAPADGVIVITGTTVIHPEREGAEAVSPDTSILIRNGRIEAVLPQASLELPRNATVIDGRGRYAIPGLVDSHVHFFQSGNLYTRPDAADFNAVVPYAGEVARNKARLPYTFKVWLASGVTGVVDIGGPFWNFEVRDRAAATAEAPHMAVAGPLISMVDRPQLDLGDPPIIRIDSPEAARALIARQLPHQPDYIKVWFIHRPGDDLAAQEAIVRAAGDAAHEAGLKLAVHATELVVAKAALRAGADFLVHSVFDQPVDEEFIALAQARDVLYCPTLFVVQGYPLALSGQWRPTPIESLRADPVILAAMDDFAEIPADQLPERVKRLMADAKPGQMLTSSSTIAAAPRTGMDNLKRLHDAGVTIVMGTDAGNIGTLHGPSIHREFALMREAGLSPAEILRAATVNGARALGLTDSAGRIAPGMRADLVLLDADPLADVAHLQRVRVVLKDGVAYDPRTLLQE